MMQVGYVWKYRREMRRALKQYVPTGIDNEYAPETAVILCVRGEDPTLIDCLAGLGIQTYREFSLHIVADHAEDKALAIVESFLQTEEYQSLNPTIHVFNPTHSECSLKCSAIIHAIQSLPESTEVVALIDADVIPDPNWLNDLIRPLQDSQIGASTGSRWFDPSRSGSGSQVRAAWNAASLPQMMIYNIPWGGSLAIRYQVIQSCSLLETWCETFCEDTILTSVLPKHGFTVKRVSELVISNQEQTTIRRATTWIARQLLTVRLHNPVWPLVFIHGLLTGLLLLLPPISTIYYVAISNWILAALSLFVFFAYELINVGLLMSIQSVNRRALEIRKVGLTERPVGFLGLFQVVLLTQAVYSIATVKAAFMKTVYWRGIVYRVGGSPKVQMQGYSPFDNAGQGSGENSQAGGDSID